MRQRLNNSGAFLNEATRTLILIVALEAEVFGEALEAAGVSRAILGASALAGPDPPAGQA